MDDTPRQISLKEVLAVVASTVGVITGIGSSGYAVLGAFATLMFGFEPVVMSSDFMLRVLPIGALLSVVASIWLLYCQRRILAVVVSWLPATTMLVALLIEEWVL